MIPFTILEVMPLVLALYKARNSACCLHIVLENNNIDNSHIEFCLDTAFKAQHLDCSLLAKILMQMTKTQRLKISKKHAYLLNNRI